MPAPKKSIAGYIAKKVVKKAVAKKSVVKVQPKPKAKVANPQSNVKVMYPSNKGIFPGINGGKPLNQAARTALNTAIKNSARGLKDKKNSLGK